ncbi:hypothetical protein Gorai_018204, partial [Gossypium raimondii]|nr:hypothetical protein [Gossypium raimondii]
MKKLRTYYTQFRHNSNQAMERKWILPLALGSIVSLFLLFLTTLTSFDGSPFLFFYHPSAVLGGSSPFVESQLKPIPVSTLPPPPRFAYLISGSAGDGLMLRRTLLALYHPLNQYVVHLDREASSEERL